MRPFVDEIPEEAIQEAEDMSSRGHDHEGVADEDGTLRVHLQRGHGLDVPDAMSPATQSGLHDRLHDERGAADN